jgi:hypothetical protein
LSDRNSLINTKRQKKKRGSPDTGHNTVGEKRKTICERKRTVYGTHSPESISLVSIERAGLSKPFNSCRLEGSDDVADVADDGCDGLLMEGPKNIKIR